jgi:hypothetical protein
MNIRLMISRATAGALGALLITAAGAQAPGTDGIDLGSTKAKQQSTTPGNVIGGPATQGGNQKAGQPPATSAAPAGIGSGVKNPLGTKTGIGVVGAPGTNPKAGAPAQEDAASSNDLQIKLPSNYNRK